jgi:hypothetical protein
MAAHILSHTGGLALITEGLCLAVQGCRRDIEIECAEVVIDGARWWDIAGGLFAGSPSEQDGEFIAMRDRAVSFLDKLGAIKRHPEHHQWIQFIEIPDIDLPPQPKRS